MHSAHIPANDGRSYRPPADRPALYLSMALASLGTSVVNLALPAIGLAFDADFHALQSVIVSYLAALTIAVPLSGWLGDRVGLRRMLLAGLRIVAAGSLAGGLAGSLPILIAARAFQGLGAAFLMTLSLALVRRHCDESRIGQAMGRIGLASAVGTALGPTLGGFVVASLGWRATLLVQVPLALGIAVISWRTLESDTEQPGTQSDESIATSESGRTARACGTLSKTDSMARSIPDIYLLANTCVAAVMMSTLVVGPFFLGVILQIDAHVVGLLMGSGPLVSMLSAVPAGRAVDRVGTRAGQIIGLVLMAVGAGLLALLAPMLGAMGYLGGIVLMTPGYQAFQAANNAAALAGVAAKYRGRASARLVLSRNIGLILGASVLSAIYEHSIAATYAIAALVILSLTAVLLTSSSRQQDVP